MTATERMRQLLDERGVEWEEPDPYQDATAWVGSNNIEYIAHEGISFDGPTGRLILFCLTPEQAVAATLGRGTCKVVSKPCDMWECECGKAWWHGGAPNYCPSCGRVAVLATPTDNATLSDLFGIWKEDE